MEEIKKNFYNRDTDLTNILDYETTSQITQKLVLEQQLDDLLKTENEFRYEVERSIVLKIQILFTTSDSSTTFKLPDLKDILASYSSPVVGKSAILENHKQILYKKLLESLSSTISRCKHVVIQVVKKQPAGSDSISSSSALIHWLRSYQPLPPEYPQTLGEQVADSIDELAEDLLRLSAPVSTTGGLHKKHR